MERFVDLLAAHGRTAYSGPYGPRAKKILECTYRRVNDEVRQYIRKLSLSIPFAEHLLHYSFGFLMAHLLFLLLVVISPFKGVPHPPGHVVHGDPYLVMHS